MAAPATGSPAAEPLSAVVLGAGYAGLLVAHEVHSRSKGKIPVVLIDRNPVHVLRTELYEVGKLASSTDNAADWVVPLDQVFDRTSVTIRQGTVRSIDLAAKTVVLDSGEQHFRSLAICLGSEAAYYGVPGSGRAHAPGLPPFWSEAARGSNPRCRTRFDHPPG